MINPLIKINTMVQSSIKETTINKWIKDNPELLYDHASELIYCSKCEAHLSAICWTNVKRHVEGAVHKGMKKEHHTSLEFYFDLIKFMILCNIHTMVTVQQCKTFFQKYMCIAEKISSCINDEEEEEYKFANLTSVDVERSFSMYKFYTFGEIH